jgi:chaperonin GroEL
MTETYNGVEFKNRLLKGINMVTSAVGSTLGPSGRNVLITNDNGELQISKDGVTISRNFKQLEDPIADQGMKLIKKVSENAVDKAGDGTTTATVLAGFMVNEGFKLIQQGSNPTQVKVGIDKSVKEVVKALSELSEDVKNVEQLKQVATVSANGDESIGELISTALDKVGEDGSVVIEESKTGETYLETVEGMMFEKGLKSPYFVTNNSTMECVLDKPLILLFDGRISSSNQLVPVLNFVAAQNRSLLIIAEDIDHEALALLIVNKSRGTVKVAAVKAPDYGDRRAAILEDIAVLTGGALLSNSKGNKLDKIDAKMYATYLGEARMATITSKDTTIVDGKSKMVTVTTEVGNGVNETITEEVSALDLRLQEIKDQFDNPRISAFDKERLQDRISKLTGGVSIINVGGVSEVEMREKKDRIDDALHATKAAWQSGVLPGGGMALISCASSLENLVLDNRDQELGKEIVKKALYAPFIKILSNAGVEDHYKVLSEINSIKARYNSTGDENLNNWEGYNVKTGNYENFKSTGIFDPTKVTRVALENAASVAGIVLTTENCVIEKNEDKEQTGFDMSQMMG